MKPANKKSTSLAQPEASFAAHIQYDTPRMQYRSRPVSVAVDPISLVISECISITSAIQKHARSPHSSVSAILGGNPNSVRLGPSSPRLGASHQGAPAGLENEDADGPSNRWGLRGYKGKSVLDNPLITGFGKLRLELARAKDIYTFDGPSLLAPFLYIIQAKGTAAPITILALGALRKFLAYGFISSLSPRFILAMQSLSAAVTHCQFDISDTSQAEVVLLMILNLMEDMMSGPGGDILSDESVCDMMGRGLAICSQPRFSPVLRRTAEATMVRMCQIIFEDVKHLEAEAGSDGDVLDKQAEGDPLSMETPSAEAAAGRSQIATDIVQGRSTSTSLETPRTSKDAPADGRTPDQVAATDGSEAAATEDTDSIDLRPYSLPSVRELFRVLVSFLDPHDRQHTDAMRVMALRIIHVALEVSGSFIARHPALASIAEDKLCCYLFQLVRSENMAILQESLIVAGTLLATCRGVLKLQQELFLSYLVACLHPAVDIPREPGIDPSLYAGIPRNPKLVKQPASQQSNSGRSTPVPVKDRQKLGLEGGARKPDARQAMVEAIGVLSRMPTFVTELFVNYDCDEDRSDLCEDMIGLLSRNALPDSATWSTTSVPPLCLDALLRYIQFIAERLDTEPNRDDLPDPDALRERRRRKQIIVKGVNKFNEKPKLGLAYLEAHGIIADASNPVEVATFLKQTSRASKSVLGDFLSKRGNEAILEAFLGQFNFAGKRVDDALRMMLESFRLPGESPLIATIIETFSDRYCTGDFPPEIANKDSVFILTYAIIMLNTDQHNPNLKGNKRMSFEDFSRNLRGQNDGQDFSRQFLQDIFDSIKSNEIILPDEHDNKHAFDYAWRELLIKSAEAGDLKRCDTNIYDADMFAATWEPIVSTLSYVFMSASDDAVYARVVAGFDECARIATRYGNVEALDKIVYCLSDMSTLASGGSFNTSLNAEVQVGDTTVMVSELAVKFGRDFRAQLATLVLFRVISGNEHMLKSSWKYVVRIWLNLFNNSLIPSFASTTSTTLPILAIPMQPPSQIIDRASRSPEAGFFSAFTSYISSYAADDPPEPSDEELESALCAVDCVASCQIPLVFQAIAKNLTTSVAAELIAALLQELPEDNSAVLTVKQEATATPRTSSDAKAMSAPAIKYDPGVAFIFEFSSLLATRDEATTELMGKEVFDMLQAVLRNSSQWHPLTLSRAVFYALKILKSSYDQDFINIPFLLHTISGLPQDNVGKTGDLILAGLQLCVEQPGNLRNEMMTSPDFWAILKVLARHPDSAASAFHILESGSTGNPPAIIADNYEAAISLLNDFASLANNPLPRRGGAEGLVSEQHVNSSQTLKEAIARGCKSINILQSMTTRVPQLMLQSQLDTTEAWSAYWLPIFQALETQCTNPCREIRQLAFSSLQRTLLSSELTATSPEEWTAIFGKVLFPLVTRLLKPEVFSSDRDGMSEMRVQSTSLICKVFLHYLVVLSEWEGMLDLWTKLIELMDRLMNSGQGDSLEEAVRENLKNVLLFMSSSGYLASPRHDESKEKVWKETWDRIDRFLPDLRSELALEEPDLQQPPTAPIASVGLEATPSGNEGSES